MREAIFIKKNKDRWQQLKESPGLTPDETAGEFIQLVEDLGYSKTFYPHSGITRYLNTESSKRYIGIYANQKESGSRITKFFKYTLPLIIIKHYKILLISLGLFLMFVGIGFFSAYKDETFVRQILGDGYVDMTEKNISEGHPFGVYGSGNDFLSFLGIFVNNFQVTLIEFGGGILFGYFTITSLMQNSIMVGAFEYMFYQHGLMENSLLTIMIHGTLELSTFVISAASGIVLAKSWIFPGTVSRMQALKTGAKEGLILAMSTMPMLFMAAFFEGFITQHADMPVWGKLIFIIFSLGIIIGYFIVYPIMLKRKLSLTQTKTAD